MNSKLKLFLKLFIPPFFFSILRILQKNKYMYFDGNFTTWSEAIKKINKGYESNEIFEKVYQASLEVKKGKFLYERDGELFQEENFRWPVISSILHEANLLENSQSFHVLDFGGSLGSFYNQHKKLLGNIQKLRWSIVEQPHFVKKGKEEFENIILKFYDNIEDCTVNSLPNIILLSSVIQYIEEPFKVLNQLIRTNAEIFIIDRTPFILEENDIVKLQHLSKDLGGFTYPSWFFSEKSFLNFFKSNGYKKYLDFECDEDFGVGQFKGIVLKRINRQ